MNVFHLNCVIMQIASFSLYLYPSISHQDWDQTFVTSTIGMYTCMVQFPTFFIHISCL